MKTETINKANELINKINQADAAIDSIKEYIAKRETWKNHEREVISIKLQSQIPGLSDYQLDLCFIDKFDVMERYLQNAIDVRKEAEKQLKQLKD